MLTGCCCVCCQVAGRLHVEVWRRTDGHEEEGPGASDPQQSDTDGNPEERRLHCAVRRSFINVVPVRNEASNWC